ncbi:MAG: MBOAT family protein [Acidimicrobiia bacterium]|nr:MBOAT family protein [Acidimicrobiia bacterium]
MLFNSFSFLGFLAVLVIAFYASPHRSRWMLLLAASFLNYALFRVEYVLLLLAVTLVGYIGALAIGRVDEARSTTRRRRLMFSVVLVLGLLFVNKYADFTIDSVNAILGRTALPRLDLAVAAGLSFYAFSCVSYLVNVFRGRLEAVGHFGKFALYIAFFPKLLAGPIERARPFLSQLESPLRFDAPRVTGGLQLVLWGLFKKVVIADRLAPLVDAAYRSPAFASPADLLLATYFFAFQLYCDFSGYSDIAIGTSRMLGVDLLENFRRPYLSTSVREFWSERWHISLSAWFRDYLYIPLGGSRVSVWRAHLNVLIVFLVSGLWHGANWTFVVWGGLNGLYQVGGGALSRLRGGMGRRPHKARPGRLVGILVTFHLVLVTWVFFRASSLGDAITVISRVGAAGGSLPRLLVARLYDPAVQLVVALICILLIVEAFDDLQSMWARLDARPIYVRWAAYYALLAMLLVLGNWNLTQFVYMQF